MTMYRKFCFVFLCMFVSSLVYSQGGASVSGRVLDQKSKPIQGASIFVLNTNLATVSSNDGGFEIKSIAAGDYTLSVSAVGFATINENVHVQAAGNAPLSIIMAESENQLDAVVVSAEKKEENLQNVPFSISALTAKNVREYRLWNTKDLTAIIPNLYAGNPGDGRNVTSIRGITSSSYDPAVTTYIDGVNQFTLDTYIPQLFDIERIEVLRGPQGTLYGRNAMGGVVNIITKQPGNKTDGFAEVSAGNYGEQRYTAGITTPLVKNKLFFGASGLYEGLNGYYTNDYNNSKFDKQHSIGGNYYLKYLASDKWALTLNVKHLAARNNGSFTLAGSAADAFSNPYHLNQNAIAKLVDNTFNTSLSVNYAGQAFNFSSQTAYQSNYRYYATPIDGDFAPIDGVTIINNYGNKWNNVKVVTQEFRFTSPASSSSPFKWTAGTYFFYQHTPNKQATHFGEDAQYVGSPQTDYAIVNTTTAKSTGAAVYAQGTYAVSKLVDIKGGIRYDYQHTTEDVLGEYLPDGSPTPVFETQPDTSASASYSAFSPMVSIAIHPTANTNLYGTYSRGYRTGGLTQLGADPSQPPLYAYKPEYSNNFEVGVKNTLLDNKLTLNIALFYTTITNAQVPTLVLPSAITITKNAGGLTSKGIDAEIAATPVKGLEATYNFGYTHARYTTLKLSSNGSEADLKGNHQVFTPDVTSMLALQYSMPVNQSQSVKAFVRGEWMYLGQEYFDLANNIRQAPYNLLNASVGITTRHLDVMLWGRNLTDKKYISYAYDFGAVHLGNPQTYGITVRGKL
ncbi:MAG TPA: TonB-dependent receptor [Chitinophagaceae bacterium]|nr:TonB-dependent receptor [Chitinophagaceae bacterium]